MKKLFFAASLLVAGFASAGTTTITNDCILGVMPVSITNTQVILSVPWVQPGGGDAIAVSNFVKTAGLTAYYRVDEDVYDGDTLTWYDGSTGKYNVWILGDVASGTNYWKIADMEGVEDIVPVNPDAAVLKQGNAVVLTRASSNETVYVIGQVGTNSTITTTIAAATETADTVSLIAPPGSLTGTFNVNTGIEYVDGAPLASTVDMEKNRITAVGDMLIRENVGGITVSYVYICYDDSVESDKKYKWVPTYDIKDTVGVKVPAGCGIWYKRKAKTSMTIRWSAMAVGN